VTSAHSEPQGKRKPHARRGASTAAMAACLLLAPATLLAQWLDYPTPGVPRDANGKPKLAAPAPRASGHVDLTGIWTAAEVLDEPCVGREIGPAGGDAPAAPAAPVAPAATGLSASEPTCIRQQSLPADQINIGRALKDGLPYQPWAADLVKARLAKQATDDPHAHCLPPNYPRAYVLPQFFKIVQTPGLLVLLHEFNASYRQIFTDGRPLPKQMNPTWNGYSTGHWEGDTLVVETAGFRDDLWLDFSGSPLTEAAHVTERFKRPSFGTLEIEVTVNDSKAYTRPWTVTLKQKLVVDTDLLDEICLENEQDTKLTDAK
jgi:hypothetical protein